MTVPVQGSWGEVPGISLGLDASGAEGRLERRQWCTAAKTIMTVTILSCSFS